MQEKNAKAIMGEEVPFTTFPSQHLDSIVHRFLNITTPLCHPALDHCHPSLRVGVQIILTKAEGIFFFAFCPRSP